MKNEAEDGTGHTTDHHQRQWHHERKPSSIEQSRHETGGRVVQKLHAGAVYSNTKSAGSNGFGRILSIHHQQCQQSPTRFRGILLQQNQSTIRRRVRLRRRRRFPLQRRRGATARRTNRSGQFVGQSDRKSTRLHPSVPKTCGKNITAQPENFQQLEKIRRNVQRRPKKQCEPFVHVLHVRIRRPMDPRMQTKKEIKAEICGWERMDRHAPPRGRGQKRPPCGTNFSDGTGPLRATPRSPSTILF